MNIRAPHWKFLISRLARKHGFLDPMVILDQLQRFTQPSEVAEPIELLRAGMHMHARGLINSRVIQHNLDWVWPYWVERQFDPRDDSFIPRAFSITHINLTHRNWTAVGLPDQPRLPIVDPRGLLTPFFDEWSLDAWIAVDEGAALLPSREPQVLQQLITEGGLAVVTEIKADGCSLYNRAEVEKDNGIAQCKMTLRGLSEHSGWLVVALRPYNPEGISFIDTLTLSDDRKHWSVNQRHEVAFSELIERHHISNYRHGDVYNHINDLDDELKGECDIGMLSSAALFRLQANTPREVAISMALEDKKVKRTQHGSQFGVESWSTCLDKACQLCIPDAHFQFLYDAAVRTLILHSVDEVCAGPYTYKRFWFRDAAYIIHGLLCAGFVERAERALDSFPSRQKISGYFHSQDGEWDSNGEALWILHRFCQLTGRKPKSNWCKAIQRGGHWIIKKCLSEDLKAPHAGLLPAGFSAEHLGPNDYYYWDDFWSVAGLRSAAVLVRQNGDHVLAQTFETKATSLASAIERSLKHASLKHSDNAMPASPYRRMDAGAIGSLVAGYPLQQFAANDPRLLDTAGFLIKHCFVQGGFFQDMIHSGVNAYLTLHIAQVLLRAGDARYFDLMTSVAELASTTGQWPEAVHPRTGGGCMGDGQHAWAAVEWLLMLRSCFIREEGDGLVLVSGIPRQWLMGDYKLFFGATLTTFGSVSIRVEAQPSDEYGRQPVVSWLADWHEQQPPIEINMPGFKRIVVDANQDSVVLMPRNAS